MACGDVFEPGDIVIVGEGVFVEGYNLGLLVGTVRSHTGYVMVELDAENVRGETDRKVFKLLTWEVDRLLDLKVDEYDPFGGDDG